jgi:hypothetical protein
MPTEDNKEILRYRGIATPSDTLEARRNAAVASLVLNASALGSNIRTDFITTQNPLGVTAVTTNPFMRLLPTVATETTYDFYFPFAPQGISYTDLSDEVSEIPRAGTTPLVTFTSHKLMKISFEFLVAIPYDGMDINIEASLNLLRIFATSSHKNIVFFNMDSFMAAAWQYRRGPVAGALYFTITDMSFDARQRNSFGRITQAIVNISVIENQNPSMTVVKVPPFKKKERRRGGGGGGSGTNTTRAPSFALGADAYLATQGRIIVPS